VMQAGIGRYWKVPVLHLVTVYGTFRVYLQNKSMHRPTFDYYSGKKYVCGNYLYSRYCKRADVTYVKCDFYGCHAIAKLDGNLGYWLQWSRIRCMATCRKKLTVWFCYHECVNVQLPSPYCSTCT
jgi:hypothetical protein